MAGPLIVFAAEILSVKLIVKVGAAARRGWRTRAGAVGPHSLVTDTNRADLRALEPHWNLSDASIYVSFYLFRSY